MQLPASKIFIFPKVVDRTLGFIVFARGMSQRFHHHIKCQPSTFWSRVPRTSLSGSVPSAAFVLVPFFPIKSLELGRKWSPVGARWRFIGSIWLVKFGFVCVVDTLKGLRSSYILHPPLKREEKNNQMAKTKKNKK